MGTRYFANAVRLKAKIEEQEDGTYRLTRYSYPDKEMQNCVVGDPYIGTYEEVVDELHSYYRTPGFEMDEVSEEEFHACFSINEYEVFSVNRCGFSLANLPYGWTQNIIIRVGRKQFYIDVRKDTDCAWVEMYPYAADRSKISKYDQSYAIIKCKTRAYLTREFFENAHEIAKAQRLLAHFAPSAWV